MVLAHYGSTCSHSERIKVSTPCWRPLSYTDYWHFTVFSSPSDQFSFSSFCPKRKDSRCTKSKSISHAKEIFLKRELGEITITKCTPQKIWEQPTSNRIYKNLPIRDYTLSYVNKRNYFYLAHHFCTYVYICLCTFFVNFFLLLGPLIILNKLVVNSNYVELIVCISIIIFSSSEETFYHETFFFIKLVNVPDE